MRIFRYDKKKNALAVQSLIMILVAALMFYYYSKTSSIIYLVLVAFAMAFVAIYFYRMFVMRIIFTDDSVTFKGLASKHTIEKKDIYDIKIIKQVARHVTETAYIKGNEIKSVNSKTYILIRKSDKIVQPSFSMFNAATDDYIFLEYTNGIETYFDKLLEQ